MIGHTVAFSFRLPHPVYSNSRKEIICTVIMLVVRMGFCKILGGEQKVRPLMSNPGVLGAPSSQVPRTSQSRSICHFLSPSRAEQLSLDFLSGIVC